jgi:hypothetical protein
MSARLNLDYLDSYMAGPGFLSYNKGDIIYTDGVVRQEASTSNSK